MYDLPTQESDMGSITPECNNYITITITFKLLLLLLLLLGYVGQM